MVVTVENNEKPIWGPNSSSKEETPKKPVKNKKLTPLETDGKDKQADK